MYSHTISWVQGAPSIFPALFLHRIEADVDNGISALMLAIATVVGVPNGKALEEIGGVLGVRVARRGISKNDLSMVMFSDLPKRRGRRTA